MRAVLPESGFVVEKGYTRADYRKSFAKLVELVGVMHKAGVPIVAGTDGSGIELVHELEIYVDAATLVPAHNVHMDKITGSITEGKTADLVLVDGDPSKHMGDLRNTRVVMMDGRLMDADALRAPRNKRAILRQTSPGPIRKTPGSPLSRG